ncbi:hypothetical protein ACFSKL_22350 [Belliella marina]|uniref:Uncharacterized protein n=1 Tax=Belliella marina TaxID=1644146 RepID=A0ABW4VTB5_9BACT
MKNYLKSILFLIVFSAAFSSCITSDQPLLKSELEEYLSIQSSGCPNDVICEAPIPGGGNGYSGYGGCLSGGGNIDNLGDLVSVSFNFNQNSNGAIVVNVQVNRLQNIYGGSTIKILEQGGQHLPDGKIRIFVTVEHIVRGVHNGDDGHDQSTQIFYFQEHYDPCTKKFVGRESNENPSCYNGVVDVIDDNLIFVQLRYNYNGHQMIRVLDVFHQASDLDMGVEYNLLNYSTSYNAVNNRISISVTFEQKQRYITLPDLEVTWASFVNVYNKTYDACSGEFI